MKTQDGMYGTELAMEFAISYLCEARVVSRLRRVRVHSTIQLPHINTPFGQERISGRERGLGDVHVEFMGYIPDESRDRSERPSTGKVTSR
jgi:hypothetical protein